MTNILISVLDNPNSGILDLKIAEVCRRCFCSILSSTKVYQNMNKIQSFILSKEVIVKSVITITITYVRS